MSNQPARTPGQTDLLTLNRAATVARLLSGVAHEVNNALQVIGGTTELLQTTPGLSPSIADGLQRIAVQNTRAATAIQEVMIFARQKIEAAGRTNLREIATRSVALRAFAIGRARLSVTIDAPATGRFSVNGNSAILQLALLNLIVNAEQALAGRAGGAIRVELEESPGSVVLRVLDNGPGIDGAAVDEMFELVLYDAIAGRGERAGIGCGPSGGRTVWGDADAEGSGCRRVLRDATARSMNELVPVLGLQSPVPLVNAGLKTVAVDETTLRPVPDSAGAVCR